MIYYVIGDDQDKGWYILDSDLSSVRYARTNDFQHHVCDN
jgi:hypothetical protein